MTKVKEALICENDLEIAARVLRAINNKMRIEILYMLQVKKRLTVKEIHENLGVVQSIASQHLSILRNERIVSVERSGKYRCYYINHRRLHEINLHAKALVATEGIG